MQTEDENNSQTDLVVVYKTNYQAAQQVLKLLRKEGFNPIALEKPDSIALHVAKNTYLTSIAVPRDQSRGAQSVLRNWEKEAEQNEKKITNTLATQFFTSILITAIISAIAILLKIITWENYALIFIIWLITILIIANKDKIK